MGSTIIGVKEVRTLPPGAVIWDGRVSGFGARRQRSEAVTYFVMYRTAEGRQRWQTIGRHGSPWTPDEARRAALRVLAEAAHGTDPAAVSAERKKALTIAALCDRYLSDARAGRLLTRRGTSKKPSTIATDAGRIERHIKPLLGSLPAAAVTRQDVERFLYSVAEGETATRAKIGKHGLARVTGGRGTATRTCGLLGAIFTYTVRQGLRPDNPAHGVLRFADRRRERRMSDAEYAALGKGLREAAWFVWPHAVAAARFLTLTGWRRGEVLNLRWPDIDLDRRTAILGDSKTGRSMRPLSKRACAVLRDQARGPGPVFQATRGDCPMTGFPSFWKRIATLGGLPKDITPHVLRHSFASVAADLGFAESTIAALLGHKGQSVTSRYTHAADSVLLAAADAVADRITELSDALSL